MVGAAKNLQFSKYSGGAVGGTLGTEMNNLKTESAVGESEAALTAR